MTEVVLDHEGHGIHGRLTRLDRHELAALGHDFRNLDVLRSLVANSHFGQVVCIGKLE